MRNSTRIGLFVVIGGLPGLAVARDCADIQDGAERLACYDAEHEAARRKNETPPPAPSDPSRAGSNPPPAPGREVSADTDVAVPADAPAEFGKKEMVDRPAEYIEASIEKVTEAGGLDYLTLDNGQVWREIQDSHLRFRPGGKVTISEGVLSSFDLKLQGYNKIAKVKRVR
jgi:hypothetical protein